ncbi:hypothetical protein [Haliangium ochraceum]|uniref:Uncharacterized protein n=1 Tax=Haliangium ochraceum (strain DSM 14365 / JCM 11303 / SMP-2) TaxID=502025 RepID=D0LMS4_HALO1|nr:hypothetical protein [Haliangium ochraceum]ACY13295.1 conserved hypothetical protein [Haliangium ochraceum DSM 14365]
MPTPCIEIPPTPDPQTLTLPGGVRIERVNLLAIAQPALSPLVPIFDIVDAVVEIVGCIEAIPESLGPPPDPTVLAARLPALADKLAKLLGLVPQLSLPLTVVGILDLVIGALREARTVLVHLQAQQAQLAGVIDRAAELDDDALASVAACAEGHIAQEAANVGASLASLGALIGVLNLFLAMLGLPDVPDLSALSGQPLDAILAPLDSLVAQLKAARMQVPVP